MMMVQLDDTGRIKAYGNGLAGGIEVTIPEGTDPFDCVVEGGVCVPDPAPAQASTTGARLAALEAANASLEQQMQSALGACYTTLGLSAPSWASIPGGPNVSGAMAALKELRGAMI